MDIPNEFFNEINNWDLNHFPTDPRVTGSTYYIRYYIRLLFTPSKALVAVSEPKLRREAKIKYDMTHPPTSIRIIKKPTEDIEYSTVSDLEELMKRGELWRLKREEFVGQPYFAEFEEMEENERRQKHMTEYYKLDILQREENERRQKHMTEYYKLDILQTVESIKQQVAVFSRSQEAINLALKDSLRSRQRVASIGADFLRSRQRAADIEADLLRSRQRAADIEADILRSRQQVESVAGIRADFLRDMEQAANIRADFLRDMQRAANIRT